MLLWVFSWISANDDFYLGLFLPGLEGTILGSVLFLFNASLANFSLNANTFAKPNSHIFS
jgi:hypothetical protein